MEGEVGGDKAVPLRFCAIAAFERANVFEGDRHTTHSRAEGIDRHFAGPGQFLPRSDNDAAVDGLATLARGDSDPHRQGGSLRGRRFEARRDTWGLLWGKTLDTCEREWEAPFDGLVPGQGALRADL